MPLLTLQHNTQTIHYVDKSSTATEGSDSKLPVLCVHGLGSSQNFWMAVIPRLNELGHRCVAIDTPGSARSSIPTSQSTVSSLAQTIVAILDELQIPRAIIMGHSMSAGLTVPAAAAMASDRVATTVLVGPVYPSKDLTTVFEDRIAKVKGPSGMQAMADLIPYTALGSKTGHIPRAMVRELLLNQPVQGYINNCNVIANAWKEREESRPPVPNYEENKAPTLIIAGDEDKSAPIAGCERIFKEMGLLRDGETKKLAILNGRGHWQCLECPEEVAESIQKFLAQQKL